MLLTSPISIIERLSLTVSAETTLEERASVQWRGTRLPSNINGMKSPLPPFCDPGTRDSSRFFQRLSQVVDDVVDVLDAHAEAKHLGSNTGFQLFVGRQLTVSRRCRMTCQRLRIAHIDHAFEQTQSVETLLPRFEAALHPESE